MRALRPARVTSVRRTSPAWQTQSEPVATSQEVEDFRSSVSLHFAMLLGILVLIEYVLFFSLRK